MLNLTGVPALDVAIGLSFIFFLLSLVASTLQEFIANIFSLRAKVLERGLRNMLEDELASPPPADATPQRDLVYRVYTHPLIRSLYRESGRWLGRSELTLPEGERQAKADADRRLADARDAAATLQASGSDAGGGGGQSDPSAFDLAAARASVANAATVARSLEGPARQGKVRLPSYIAPRSFALALLDTIAPDVAATTQEGTPRADHDVIRETRERIESLTISPSIEHRLLSLLDAARGDIDTFRRNVEAWFDDTMARVSGWYKRRAQLIIFVLAVLLTGALNANTLTIGERLWRDPTLRATLVQQAGSASLPSDTGEAKQKLRDAVDDVESVTKAGVPIGWAQGAKEAKDPRHIATGNVGDVAHWLGGWLLTILAVSLGAPFWFDTLSRLSRLRGTGKPETPLPASGRGQPGERVVTGTPPVNVAVQHVPAIAAASAPPASGGTRAGR